MVGMKLTCCIAAKVGQSDANSMLLLSGVIVSVREAEFSLDDGTAVCDISMESICSPSTGKVKEGMLVDVFVNARNSKLCGTGVFPLSDPNTEALRFLQQIPPSRSAQLRDRNARGYSSPRLNTPHHSGQQQQVQVHSDITAEALMTQVLRTKGATLAELAESLQIPWAVVGPILDDLQCGGLVYSQNDKFYPL